METHDLLLEIGVEELPASFVDAALRALPTLASDRLKGLRLSHGQPQVLGTPRRLALIVPALADHQPDLEQELLGPPASAAFDKQGAPTRAAEAFAKKVGVEVGALSRVQTPKGEYLGGVKREAGRPARELLGEALAQVCAAIPFRKSMRWGTGEATFGRPVRWLVALYGGEVVPFLFAGLDSGRVTYGHRFLQPGAIELEGPGSYGKQLEAAHVVASPAERAGRMTERLQKAAAEAGGALIEDAFLVGENLSLVEEPHVIVGSFEERFLRLPEEVILEVARGHQRYFGVRGADGKLLPRYLAVVNTALEPATIVRGNDRVMRARLSDAQFFFDEDLKQRLEARASKLEGIVFHNRLGSVAAKVLRVTRLARLLAEKAALTPEATAAAERGAALAKCDLVTLMVGEFPELQGVMGRAYALAQGESEAVADIVRDHYAPKGAHDDVAPGPAAAAVALADRLDTLVGCFAVGLSPTGAADPYALRRACIGTLRTLLGHGWDLSLADLVRLAYAGLAEQNIKLDLDARATEEKLADFVRERLRNLLGESFPADVVDACLAVASDRPIDARARCAALGTLAPELRAKVGEVFKRATNIAKEAPEGGQPVPPTTLEAAPHAAELAVYEGFLSLTAALTSASAEHDYARAFAAIGAFAPLLHEFFTHVLVIAPEAPLRENRLRLMRALRDACGAIAHVQLLQPPQPAQQAAQQASPAAAARG
jgi:glycyl-tRNA synthetase beta chain